MHKSGTIFSWTHINQVKAIFLAFAFVLLSFSWAPQPSSATTSNTYYVAKTGSDSNAGTEAAPWLTIQKAANTAVAGDTIFVRAGSYNERPQINRIGTAGSLITFKPYPGETVVVMEGFQVNGDYNVIHGFEITPVSVNPNAGESVLGAIALRAGATYNQILDNYVHDTKNETTVPTTKKTVGIYAFAGADNNLIQNNNVVETGHNGIYIASANNTIKDNMLDHNGYDYNAISFADSYGDGITISGPSATGNLIENNNVQYPWSLGIRIDGTDNTVRGNTLENIIRTTVNGNPELMSTHKVAIYIGITRYSGNIFENNFIGNAPSGIELIHDSVAGNPANPAENIIIRNNIFTRPTVPRYAGVINLRSNNATASKSVFIYNNVFNTQGIAPSALGGNWANGTIHVFNNIFTDGSAMTLAGGTGTMDIFDHDYNLFLSSANYPDGGMNESHGKTADPKFVDAGANNYRLQPNSPAIDAGISDGAPVTDKDGRLRYDDSDTANTGGGGAPYYDIGAYEYQGTGSQTTDTTPPVTIASSNPSSPDGANNWFTATPLINMVVSEAALTYYQWDSTSSGNWQLYLTTPIIAPEGTHTLNFYSVDAANNTESIQNHVYQVDFTSPGDPTISSPSHATGNWSADNTIETSWSGAADAASGVDGYSVAWSNSAVTVPDNVKDMEETSTQATSASLADGIWYFHVRTKDNAGNWTSTAHFGPFWIDGTGPSSPGTTAEAGGAANNTWQNSNADPIFSWAEAADSAGSGVRGYYYYWGTDPSGNPTNWTTATAFDPPAIPDGSTYYLRLKSEDMVGNRSSASTSFTFKYDADAPVDPNIAAADPDKDAWTGDDTIDISWAGAFDGASGIDGYSITWSNSATTNPDTVKDMEETSTSTTSGQLSNGSWYFHLRTRDNAGNWTSTIHYGPFLINTGLPNTSVAPAYPDGDNSWFKSVPTISLTADQAASTYYSWDSTNTPSAYSAPFQPLGSGQHTLYYYSVSNANETETLKNRIFKVDSAAPGDPVVSSSSHSAGNWSNDNTVRISLSGATDAISGIDGYSIEWSNSATTLPDTVKDLEGTANSTISPPLANGIWYANIRTKDNAGNWTSTIHSGPFKIDSTAPSDTVVLNGDASYTNSTQVTIGLAATDGSGSGLYKMRFSNDGIFDNQDTMEGWHDYTNSLPWALTPGDETKYVYAQYMDRAGNVSRSFSASILLDSSGPQAAMSAPAYSTNQSNTTNLSLSWSGSDPSPSSNISSFDVQRKDGLRGAWQNWQSATPARSAYMAGLPGHTYYFRVRARDSAGNLGGWSAESPVTFPFDSTYPAIRYSTWDWLTYNHNTSQFYRGTSKYSSRSGATVSLRFRGRQIALISAKGPGRGRAAAYIDDRFVGVIDTYAPETRHRAVVYVYPNNPSSGYERHKLTIRVLHQKNRASRGFRFDIDGFGVTR